MDMALKDETWKAYVEAKVRQLDDKFLAQIGAEARVIEEDMKAGKEYTDAEVGKVEKSVQEIKEKMQEEMQELAAAKEEMRALKAQIEKEAKARNEMMEEIRKLKRNADGAPRQEEHEEKEQQQDEEPQQRPPKRQCRRAPEKTNVMTRSMTPSRRRPFSSI